ncbi:DBH-like monooxygenase protein 1 [Hypanus sabinus]|uniref:DBH-like monooxygenase protein 1 n=1 Tax=Hypanus sabinus TaxID=79690 RepID=UPI0028C3B554|nr:DBH-like monooxygenase protein 1 [Hypanus sabinus]
MVEPVIKTSVPSLLYQMILYSCPSSYDQSRLSPTTDCFLNGNSTALFTGCVQVIAVWGIGTKPGQSLIYPDEAGFSLGAKGDPNFYVLQVHYDNRGNRTALGDSATLRSPRGVTGPPLRASPPPPPALGQAARHRLLVPQA